LWLWTSLPLLRPSDCRSHKLIDAKYNYDFDGIGGVIVITTENVEDYNGHLDRMSPPDVTGVGKPPISPEDTSTAQRYTRFEDAESNDIVARSELRCIDKNELGQYTTFRNVCRGEATEHDDASQAVADNKAYEGAGNTV
jgi:hypothetical protein